MNTHILPRRIYILIWSSLMALLFLTWGLARINLGSFNIVVMLSIAIIKTVLVILFFMGVRHSSGLVRIIIVAGFFWLALLIAFTMADYRTRSWTPAPDSWSTTAPPTHP